MTSKIVRADGVTELSNIKSCVYTESVNAEENLRPGCVSSASIEVTVYGAQTDAPAAGEALTYYQVQDNTETLIGVFYAEPSISTKATYTFTAYDAVSKLDVDYSARLSALQASFPMTVYDLVTDACDWAGVTLETASWPFYTQSVEAFYAEGLTCRNILQYAAEIACRYVRCNSDGELVFDWYAAKGGYKVYYTSGSGSATPATDDGTGNVATNISATDDGTGNITLSGVTATESGGAVSIGGDFELIPYKQDGLNYENYNTAALGITAVQAPGDNGNSYLYPTVFAIDNGNGALELFNVTGTEGIAGALTISGAIISSEVGTGGLVVVAEVTNDNTITIYGNLLLTNASNADMVAIATHIFTELTALGQYRPAKISLFPFMNPFRAGDIVPVTDIQGVSFNTLVMTLSVSSEQAYIESTGAQTYDTSGTALSRAVANLSSTINQINTLSITRAEIQKAVISVLEAEGIDAKRINVKNLDATNITSGLLLASLLKLFGSMSVFPSAGSDIPAGEFGYTRASPTLNGMGMVVNGGQCAMFVNPQYMLFGLHGPEAPWLDGGDLEFNVSNISAFLKIFVDADNLDATVAEINADTVKINDRDVLSEIGNLSSLNTTNKSSIVAAINELYSML